MFQVIGVEAGSELAIEKASEKEPYIAQVLATKRGRCSSSRRECCSTMSLSQSSPNHSELSVGRARRDRNPDCASRGMNPPVS